ncbi:Uncharacterized protein Fot_29381 [Forsythia ovata]|uniref:Uncharacterized protein n=1 Tax=Forsythia ovata TaxID=205694 RepID=A0ABD1TRN7_9LAMI
MEAFKTIAMRVGLVRPVEGTFRLNGTMLSGLDFSNQAFISDKASSPSIRDELQFQVKKIIFKPPGLSNPGLPPLDPPMIVMLSDLSSLVFAIGRELQLLTFFVVAVCIVGWFLSFVRLLSSK